VRITALSIFILMFCLSSALIVNLPGFAVSGTVASQQGLAAQQQVSLQFNNTKNNNLILANDDVFGFKTLWSFKTYFFRVLSSFFSYALNLIPLLISLGVPNVFAVTIQVIIYVVYIASIVEFVINKRVV